MKAGVLLKVRSGLLRDYFIEFDETEKYSGERFVIKTNHNNANTNNVYNPDYDIRSLCLRKQTLRRLRYDKEIGMDRASILDEDIFEELTSYMIYEARKMNYQWSVK